MQARSKPSKPLPAVPHPQLQVPYRYARDRGRVTAGRCLATFSSYSLPSTRNACRLAEDGLGIHVMRFLCTFVPFVSDIMTEELESRSTIPLSMRTSNEHGFLRRGTICKPPGEADTAKLGTRVGG